MAKEIINMGEIFYPFSTLEDIQGDYLPYVESFQQIKSQEIKDCIEETPNLVGEVWEPVIGCAILFPR